MAYPPVHIVDSTPFSARGKVEYASLFCSNDDYFITPTHPFTNDRGVCLITKITATVETSSGNVEATPYTSSGTSFSQFAVIQTGPNTFQVTRVVNALEDQPPADYVEPTTQQK
jgi:hypothetical protein